MIGSGSHNVPLSVPARSVEAELAGEGWSVALLDGRTCGSKTELLSELARALWAPDWFGQNWDALVDLLRTRAAAEPVGVAIVIDRAQHLGGCRDTLTAIVDELSEEGTSVGLHLRSRPAFFRSAR